MPKYREAIIRLICTASLVSCAPLNLPAAEPGAAVVVVYNARLPESKQVAEYYAQKRQVPSAQVFGFDLPTTEEMTRREYLEGLERPLLQKLTDNKLFVFEGKDGGASSEKVEGAAKTLKSATFRYVALCYGVPTKITRDPTLQEEEEKTAPPELRRNEAAVDSQLALLPASLQQRLVWMGPLNNPFFGATNGAGLHPTSGVLLVTRLDGPSAAIARGLVDKAIEAEANGLWGRAYIDARGLTNGTYKLGDDWMRGVAEICRRMGFETVFDDNPSTFPPAYPLSQVGIYAGWYDQSVSGPFTRPTVEFVPGAFAYHLYSFGARTIRTATDSWVGTLLAKGATITLGCVDEPYLMGTPDIAMFCSRLLQRRFSFGEAALAAQAHLSWQTIAIGDPLYRPMARRPDLLHAELEQRQSPWAEWSYLREATLRTVYGDPEEAIAYLEALPATRKSAILLEKLGDLYWGKKKLSDAVDQYAKALKLKPSPQQRVRIMLNLAQRQLYLGRDLAAFELYQQFLKEFPDFPDRLEVCQKLLPVARRLNKQEAIDRCENEIKAAGKRNQ